MVVWQDNCCAVAGRHMVAGSPEQGDIGLAGEGSARLVVEEADHEEAGTAAAGHRRAADSPE